MSDTPVPETATRAGIVAIVGRANVGKSSLINAMLEEKVSIVSPVAQTTRNMIRGILTDPRGQIVFQDTPGVHKAVSDLGKMMNRMARAAVEGVDVVMLVLDGSQRPRQEDEGWISRLVECDVPVVAVLNKSDAEGRFGEEYKQIWAAKALERNAKGEAIWVSTSAVTGEGVIPLVDRLLGMMPESPLLFPADVLTDYPRKLAIADVIREKLFHNLRDELPHAVAIWVETLEETDTEWNVRAMIYVNKFSQKGIVIGEKGRLLRKVKRSSEGELKTIYGRPVNVELWVKVEKDWNRNFWLLKKFGYAN